MVLGWGVDDKAVLLNLEIDTIQAKQGSMELEVDDRASRCHAERGASITDSTRLT